MKISKPADKKFEVILIKKFTELRRRMNEQSENFSKRVENIFKK